MGHKLPSRARARPRAVGVLYEAHLKDSDDLAGIYSLAKLRGTEITTQTPMPPYTREILKGITGHLDRINAALATYFRTWSLYQMPEMNLTTMRVATWETSFDPDVNGPVTITAAIQLAMKCFTDESPKLISGLLGTINDMREALIIQGTPRADSDADAGIPEPVRTPVDFDAVTKAVRDYARQEGGVLSRTGLESPE